MKKFLFILFSFGLFPSCSDEIDHAVEKGKEDITYTAGEIRVDIENPGVATRATAWNYDHYFPNGDIYHEDSKHERWQHNLSIAYFDMDFKLEHFQTTIDHSTFPMVASDIYANSNTTGYSVFTLGIGLPITTGAHYFYILSNVSNPYLDWLNTFCADKVGILTKDEFEKLVLKDHPIDSIACLPRYSSSGDLKPRSLMTNTVSPSPHYMAPYEFTTGSGSYPAVNGISMAIGKSFAKVSVAYIPETTTGTLEYVEYRMVNDPKEMYLLPNIFKGQVHTPHYTETPGTDFDAYFDTFFNPSSHISKTFTDSTNFSWRPATLSPDDNKAFTYCMENGNETPLQGNSTMVLIKARYRPADNQWLNLDDTPGPSTGDGTFWRIKNASGSYLSGYYNEEPRVGNKQEVVKYTQGITYYPIWLETDGRYMVKRNHYYKIAITEVKSAGAPDPENAMDPAEPLIGTYSSTQTRSSESGTNLPEVATGIGWKQKN